MKKITFLLILCFAFNFNSHAQLFSEDFSGDWQCPGEPCWESFDEDGDGFEWFNIGSKMGSFSWNGVQYTPDDYVVSPPIDVTNATALFLNYKAGTNFTAPYAGEVFTVYVSTGEVVPTDFLTPGVNGVTTISSGPIDLATFPAAQGMLGDFNFDLSALDGETEIFIAFRHHSTPSDQGMLQIDNVVVTGTILGLEDNAFAGFNYFVDARHILQLSSANRTLDGITIFNLLGQSVLSNKLFSNNASINLSGLHSGVYIAQVNIDGIINSFKILKK